MALHPIPVRHFFLLLTLVGSRLAASADEPPASASPDPAASRITREIDGVTYEFSPPHEELVASLALRIAVLNRATDPRDPAASTPADAAEFNRIQADRDSLLGRTATLLGFDGPTALQTEAFDAFLRLLHDWHRSLHQIQQRAPELSVVRRVQVWDKADLLQRLRAGETHPRFSAEVDRDVVHFNWNLSAVPPLTPEEREARRQQVAQERFHYRCTLEQEDGVIRFRSVIGPKPPPVPDESPKSELSPPPESAEAEFFFPLILRPEHAGLPPETLAQNLVDNEITHMQADLKRTFTPTFAPLSSTLRLLLFESAQAALRERFPASPSNHWLVTGVARHVAHRVVLEHYGTALANEVCDLAADLRRYGDLRSAIVLTEAPSAPVERSRLPNAHAVFAQRAVLTLVERHGEPFLAQLLGEIARSTGEAADLRTADRIYRQLTRSELAPLLADAANAIPAPAPAPVHPQAPRRGFAHEHSDLSPDSRVTWGQLDNGLRYAVLTHPNPPARASMHLLIDVGSYHENDDERGYAHFVEHLVFNGTRSFPGKTAIEELERLGVTFGPHVNAATNHFTTEYKLLNLPMETPEALELGLRVLRGFAGEALIEQREVKAERNVLLQEMRHHSGTMFQFWRDELEFAPPHNHHLHRPELDGLFDETRLERRYPSGTVATTRRATARTLRAFYDRWYRPERMVLAVTGDVDAASAEALIHELFSPLQPRGPAGVTPAIEPPPVPPGGQPRIFARAHHREPLLRVTLANSVPRTLPDGTPRRREALMREMALSLLLRRVQHTAHASADLRAWMSHLVPGWDLTLLSSLGQPADLDALAGDWDREVRRAYEHGFTPVELQEEIERRREAAGAWQTEASNLPCADFGEALAYSILRDIVFTSPADEARLVEETLSGLTPEDVHEAFRALWPWHRQNTIVYGPIDKREVENGRLHRLLLDRRAEPLPPYQPPPQPAPFPYTDFGPAGTVVENHYNETLDARWVAFANGVRLIVKRTEFERSRAHLRVSHGYGFLGAPSDDPAMRFATFALAASSHAPLPGWPRGKRYAVPESARSVGVFPDHSNFESAATGPAIRTLLQAHAAYFVHPPEQPDNEPTFRRTLEAWMTRNERTPLAAATGRFHRALYPGHQVTQNLETKDVLGTAYPRFFDWLRPQLPSLPLEIAIVGDIEPNEAIAWVAETFGTLPVRRPRDPLISQRQAEPATAFRESITFQGSRSVAGVVVGWWQPDAPGVRDDAELQLLARILRGRLFIRLREELGEAYVTETAIGSRPGLQPELLSLFCQVEAAPKRADRVAKAVRKVAAVLARDGVTPAELERARQQLLRAAEAEVRTNAWWIDRLGHPAATPGTVAALLDRPALFTSITKADLDHAARRLLRAERCGEIIARPAR